MKIYYAGNYTKEELDVLTEYDCPIMQNWSTVDKKDPIWKKLKTGEISDVIFDSGGFQWQTGTRTTRNISLEHYALWLELTLREYPNIKYMNLDVLGDNEKSLRNLNYLESQGLHPIPIWHVRGSDVYDYILEYYCNYYEYIAFGGMVVHGKRIAYKLSEFIMQKYPHMKIHLLGVGSALSKICKIYRPYSADSSTWLSPVRWGQEITFNREKGELEVQDMPEDVRRAIRKNNEARTELARKTVHEMKEFENSMNKSEPSYPYQLNMFV